MSNGYITKTGYLQGHCNDSFAKSGFSHTKQGITPANVPETNWCLLSFSLSLASLFFVFVTDRGGKMKEKQLICSLNVTNNCILLGRYSFTGIQEVIEILLDLLFSKGQCSKRRAVIPQITHCPSTTLSFMRTSQIPALCYSLAKGIY